MSGITSFTAIGADSALNFAWTVNPSYITVANITKITIILNDFGAGKMQQYNITPVITENASGEQTVTLTAKITTFGGIALQNGVEYGAAIAINTTTSVYSAQLEGSIKPLSVPNKPIISVTSRESAIDVKLTNFKPNADATTGFSELTGINIFLSSAGTNPKIFKLIQLTPSDFGADLKGIYALEHGVNGLDIQNGFEYEVAVTVSNLLGQSPISDTFVVTPNDLPGIIVDRTAMPQVVYDGTSTASAVVLFGNASDQVSLATAEIPILNYKVYRYGLDTSANIKKDTQVLIQTIVTNSSTGLSTTPDASYNFNDVNYPFRVIDATVVLGTEYKYSIVGTNKNGVGVENFTDAMRAGKLPDAPTLTLTPGDETVTATAVKPANMGGFIPYTTTPDASGAFSYFFRYAWYVPDASGVLQQIDNAYLTRATTPVSPPAALLNGTTYTVKAETITQYQGVYYYSTPAIATSVPYGPASAPGNLTLHASYDSGPLNGYIDLTWHATNNTNGSTGEITYSVLVEDGSGVLQVVASGISEKKYSLGGLTNGTSYTIAVRADVYNTEIKSSVAGTPTATQSATPFRLPNPVTNLRVTRPSSSSFNILFDICGNITGKTDARIRSKIVVQELSGNTLIGSPSETVLEGIGAKNFLYNGTQGASYQIDVTSGVFENVIFYNSRPVSIKRTMFGTPDAPRNFNVQALSKGFRVTFDEPNNLNGSRLTGYRIVRGSQAAGYITIASISKDIQYYIAENFSNGVTVNISIFTQAAADHENDPIESIAAGPVTITPTASPSAPQNLTAAGADSQVTLTWTKDPEVTGYQVTQDDNPTYTRTYLLGDGSGWTFGVGSTISFVASGLTNGTTYAFKVSAFVTNGGSSVYSADTSVSAVPFAAPSIPQNLTCEVASQSITSSWTAPASTAGANLGDNGPILYNLVIDASYTDASNVAITANILNQSGITAAQIPYVLASSSLLNGRRYNVKVSAYFINSSNNNKYESLYTTPVSVVVNPPPQDVSGLTIVPGNFQNVISWTNPTDALTYPRTNVKIFQKLGSEDETLLTTLTPIVVSGNTTMPTTYTATGLQNGGSYSYRVVSEHSVAAQQAKGISRTGMPFGKAVLISATPNSSGSSQYSLTINKNGSNLLDYVAIGALPDVSGNLAIPVVQGTVPANAIYSGAAGSFSSGGAFAANQQYTLVINMGVNVNAVLAIIENGAGFITKTIPTGTNTTFGNL